MNEWLSDTHGLRRYAWLTGAMMATFLGLFGLAEVLGLSLLRDPTPWMTSRTSAAVIGIGLLVADVFLPVPASLVMLAHGAIFGVLGGTLVSCVGGLGAFALGFGTGRLGQAHLRRLVTPAEHARAGALLARHGLFAIVLTRPVPILAETLAILAGASPLGWGRALLAASAGLLPVAWLYALAGASAAREVNGLWVFALVMVISGAFWWWGRGDRQAPETARD
jgi:uncharacterized membrane protein YdjX (TVP38/TMEM64 family)